MEFNDIINSLGNDSIANRIARCEILLWYLTNWHSGKDFVGRLADGMVENGMLTPSSRRMKKLYRYEFFCEENEIYCKYVDATIGNEKSHVLGDSIYVYLDHEDEDEAYEIAERLWAEHQANRPSFEF